MADGIAVKTRHNLPDVLRELDDWTIAVVDVAGPRALNKVRDQAEVAGKRVLAQIYGVPVRTIEKYLSRIDARRNDLEASISARGEAFALYLFDPRQVKGRLTRKRGGFREGGGTSVKVKGRRFLIEHAFIATMKNGHRGVFARGAYGGKGVPVLTGQAFGRFRFGRKRLSINELLTFGAPEAFGNAEVVEAMQERADDQLPIVLSQEIRFASR